MHEVIQYDTHTGKVLSDRARSIELGAIRIRIDKWLEEKPTQRENETVQQKTTISFNTKRALLRQLTFAIEMTCDRCALSIAFSEE